MGFIKIQKVCECCKKEFTANNHKTKYCNYCCERIKCKICNRTFNRYKNTREGLCYHCWRKNKKYKELYGDKIVKCGFQPGDKNLSKREDIRKKISEGVKNSYTIELLQKRREQAYKNEFYLNKFTKNKQNINGELFRSNLEVIFSNLLLKNNIIYKYEQIVNMLNGRKKVVDFVIDDNIFIEITGYAYTNWKKDFNNKIKWLKKSLKDTDFIYIISYSKNIKELNSKCNNTNILFDSIDDTDKIIDKIKWLKNINKINKRIKNEN